MLGLLLVSTAAFARAQTTTPQAPAPGTVEPAFNPGAGLGQTSSINSLARQADGKILVVGAFSYIDGALRQGLVRLNPNGRIDPTFQPPDTLRSAEKILLQPDGKILVSRSSFLDFNLAQPELIRLHPDGSRDASFQFEPQLEAAAYFPISALTLQPDGKILVGLAGPGGLLRLLGDGRRDFSFVALTGFEVGISALAVQADGKIWIGGAFTTVDGVETARLVRLRADGRLDTAFPSAAAGDGSLIPSAVRSLVVQPNGKILVVGTLTPLGSRSLREGLTRLNANGTLDSNFRPAPELAAAVNKVVLQGDGNLLVNVPTDANFLFPPPLGAGAQRGIASVAGTDATTSAELTRTVVTTSRIFRLLPDGRFDPGFVPASILGPPAGDDVVTGLALQTGGRILIGGKFNAVNEQERGSLAQLDANGVLGEGFNPAPQLPGAANVLLPLPDGRVVVSGSFATADGALHANLVRFGSRGSLDDAFGAETDGVVTAMARQSDDGAIVLVGDFQHVNGVKRPRLARLRANGALDSSLALSDTLDFFPAALALQADGKILVGGFRTVLSGDLPAPLLRLNPNGSVDTTFRSVFSGDNSISGIAVQSDGNILVSGTFRNVPDQIIRLLPDGSRDPGFGTASSIRSFSVANFILQSDGRIVVSRRGFDSTPTEGPTVLRLLSNGQRDPGFTPAGVPPVLGYAAAVQADGKIFLVDSVTDESGVSRPRVRRLNGDGSAEVGFHAPIFDEPYSLGAYVAAVAVLTDGDSLVGGFFSLVDGQVHHGLARLNGGPGVPGFFAGQASIGENWYHLEFFGDYYFGYFPFVYHTELGFEYFIDARDAARGAYFYDFGLRGFLYTSPTLFPYLYDFNARAFLYYFRGTVQPRVFANLKTGAFVFSE